MFAIEPVRTREDVEDARRLFADYARGLGVDLAYQNFAAELAGLPGAYAPPYGALLLARAGDRAVGCVALRPIGQDVCEMKRLFVAPAARGAGLGERLVRAIIAEARRTGYAEMRLDTLLEMRGAQALYRKLGFGPIDPYYETPIAGTVFLGLRLTG